MRLTALQEELLKWVHRAIKDEGRDYFYCETGDCKPWDNRTVSALEHRGIVKFVEGGDMFIQMGGVYFLTFGTYYTKKQREEKLKTILDDY